MTFRIHPDALIDTEVALEWYQKRNEEIARHFITAIENAISRAMTNPTIYRVRENQCRFCKIDGFPYHLVFRLAEDHIQVFAIAHTSRQPGFWSYRPS